jgi:hypothetical protein
MHNAETNSKRFYIAKA